MEKAEFYRRARRDLTGPLAGVRVVEATTTWAGPMCGCILADLGADVVKVELPGGEVARRVPPFLPGSKPPLSFMHATVNRNKRSVTLDLRRPDGRDLFLRLAARADVVVENFRPGTLGGWGLGYEEVRAVRPDVVYVSISGFGQFGPESPRVGYDPVAQAASGWLSLNGDPDGPPVKSPTFLGDDLGGVHGAIGALAALRHRDQTGEGQHVDVSLLDALLYQSNGYPTLGALDVPMPRLGSSFQVAAPAGVYPCGDGFIMAGVMLDTQWRTLARLMGRAELAEHPDWSTAPARIARRDEANAMLAAWLAPREPDATATLLNQNGLPGQRVRSYAEAARDPHVRERDMLQPTTLEDGSTAPIVGPSWKLSRTPVAVRSGAPALGAHTAEVLSELGLAVEEIARLRADGVV